MTRFTDSNFDFSPTTANRLSSLIFHVELLLHRAPAASTGRLQDEDVGSVDVDGALAAEIDQSAVVASKKVEATRASLASSEAVGPQNAAIREDGQLQRLPENRFSDDAVAAVKLSPAAAALRQREALEVDGIPAFQDFGVGQASVGHMDVDARLAVPARTGTRSSSNGFVVSENTKKRLPVFSASEISHMETGLQFFGITWGLFYGS